MAPNSLSLDQISSSLQQATTKKQNLRKTFDSVEPSELASLNLQWSDLDSHFSSLHTPLESRLKQLQSKSKSTPKPAKAVSPKPKPKPSSTPKQDQNPKSDLVARAELKSFCLKMDGIGLRNFIMDHRKEVPTSRDEVAAALRFAPDPAKLVLNALQGFYPMKNKKQKGGELGAIRRTCVLLLEGVSDVGPVVKPEVKDEANKVAVGWKGKVSTDSDDQLEALVYLQLLGTFGLAGEFSVNELLDLIVSIARRRQAVELCRGLGFDSKVPDLIKKLNSKGKQIDAIKFAHAFELVDAFPPVPLLEAYLKESKKVSQEVLDKGKNSRQSQNEAIAREISYLKSMIKCIEEYNLESQYPRASLEKRIEELEKQKPAKKRIADAPQSSKVQQEQQNVNKRPRLATSNTADINLSSSVNYLQQSNYVPEHLPPYLNSSRFGLVGSNTTVAHYLSATGGPSGLGLDRLNVGASLNPSSSHLYSSASHMPSGLFSRPTSYDTDDLLSKYRALY